MIEGQRAAAFVFSALAADAAFSQAIGGRLYRDQVPQTATLPAATVTLVSSTDMLTLGADRVWASCLVDVRLVAAGPSYSPINAAADRADAVLSHLGGTNGGAQIVEVRREQVMAFLENDAGATFSHIVQTFRTEAYSAA